MENCQHQGDKIAFVIILLMLLSMGQPNQAHYIQIDQHEFRANGYPQPQLPPPIEQVPHHLYATKELTPAELMVDLTNDLTYRILHYHSILNRNNFAFSPCSLMSVLVALYEGSAGRSATELKNVLQLPNNRDIIRVGYRDIHRRLRTYFFGTENPLKGLSLNKENVTITKTYEAVLKFYGYDLGMDMVSSTIMPTTTTTISPETTLPTTTIKTTTEEAATTTTDTPPKETTTSTVATTTTTTEQPKETTTAMLPTTTTTTTETITTETSTIPPTTSTTPETTTVETTTTAAPETTTTTETSTTIASEGEAAELVSSFVTEDAAEPFLRIQKARVSRLPSAKLQAPIHPATAKPKYLPPHRAAYMARESRHKRHLLNVKEMDANLFVTLFNPEPAQHSLFPVSGVSTDDTVLHNQFEVDITDPHFLKASSDTKQNFNTDVISHIFYLSQQQIIHTTFKVYNAVLYYKYFDHLKMSVLELELDTPEYNLMILLPDYHTDLVSAAASLKLGPTLRLMRRQLKPKWVQAIIPDFELHGTMFLTNDLQNMGICDIFEPNRADFHPMTNENRIYVKHIEQSINVNIRTHPINQLKRNYGTQSQPIQISVSHPFLFFVIDRDLDVAVMAGRILNPLNVRIQ